MHGTGHAARLRVHAEDFSPALKSGTRTPGNRVRSRGWAFDIALWRRAVEAQRTPAASDAEAYRRRAVLSMVSFRRHGSNSNTSLMGYHQGPGEPRANRYGFSATFQVWPRDLRSAGK